MLTTKLGPDLRVFHKQSAPFKNSRLKNAIIMKKIGGGEGRMVQWVTFCPQPPKQWKDLTQQLLSYEFVSVLSFLKDLLVVGKAHVT